MEEMPPAVVIDNGSGSLKAGFSGEDFPKTVFQTVIGHPRDPKATAGVGEKDSFIGDDAQRRRDVLSLKYPVQRGLVTNWDDMEKIWHYVYENELHVEPENQPVLLTEAPLNPKPNREMMTQIMFETFMAPGFFVHMTSILAVHSACRRSTGAILDSGDGVTHVVPFYNGFCQNHAIKRLDMAGGDLTYYLSELLRKKGYSFSTLAELEIVREMKEKLCYVAMDFEQEQHAFSTSREKNFTLPDGSVISLDSLKVPGIHEMMYNAIQDCDIDARKKLSVNMVLVGGSTVYPNMKERMLKEMKALNPPDTRCYITAHGERQYSVWIGGSVITAYSPFRELWITKEEYDEIGPTIVHRRCI